MPHPNQPVAVRHPEMDAYVVLDPAVDYDPSDILVETYPTFFAARETGTGVVESVRIEQTTAEPGQKRTRTAKK